MGFVGVFGGITGFRRGRALCVVPELTTDIAAGSLPTDENGRVLLKNLSRTQLDDFVTSLGEKPFRAAQLWRWMYHPDSLVGTFEEMTDLSKAFRAKLEDHSRVDSLTLNDTHVAKDGTRKITYKLEDGGIIESVWIPTNDRVTLCISSQLGCALNCQFCFTAKMGLRRHLSLGEIVDQVVLSKRFFDDKDETGKRITNIVFMGMGEPLHNTENVIQATNILTSNKGLGLSHNKVTVSTSGLVPEIVRFFKESPANLAVSLNATTDEIRDWIMPINKKYDLASLLGTLKTVVPRREDGKALKKIFFEYVLLKGVNDTMDDAKRIVKLTSGIPCKVNLISFNPHSGTEFEPSPPETMEMFSRYLASKGVRVTARASRGDDEMAACGQLGKPGDKPSPPRTKIPPTFEGKVKGGSTKRRVGRNP
ncbi:hypothetical protein NDN08_003763 [Rhodosorus marinus]|uniref:Radical SAM core domain-containing protein n=1 Tax=Rhodosorus marinus TaxID=101924 RepID=A0AAV8UHU0_9RHOD|nr:hypothetical protein NDN08_003763 [Rhodosorus marinus]